MQYSVYIPSTAPLLATTHHYGYFLGRTTIKRGLQKLAQADLIRLDTAVSQQPWGQEVGKKSRVLSHVIPARELAFKNASTRGRKNLERIIEGAFSMCTPNDTVVL